MIYTLSIGTAALFIKAIFDLFQNHKRLQRMAMQVKMRDTQS